MKLNNATYQYFRTVCNPAPAALSGASRFRASPVQAVKALQSALVAQAGEVDDSLPAEHVASLSEDQVGWPR